MRNYEALNRLVPPEMSKVVAASSDRSRLYLLCRRAIRNPSVASELDPDVMVIASPTRGGATRDGDPLWSVFGLRSVHHTEPLPVVQFGEYSKLRMIQKELQIGMTGRNDGCYRNLFFSFVIGQENSLRS